jgi:hypothetical protein
MDQYIGIDAHSESCTVAVTSAAGKQLRQQVVDTQAKVLIEVVKGIAGNGHVCIEEGQLAEWLVETLGPYAKEMAVVQPKEHRGHKSDAADAWALAEQLRLRAKGTYVFKPTTQSRRAKAPFAERERFLPALTGRVLRGSWSMNGTVGRCG